MSCVVERFVELPWCFPCLLHPSGSVYMSKTGERGDTILRTAEADTCEKVYKREHRNEYVSVWDGRMRRRGRRTLPRWEETLLLLEI